MTPGARAQAAIELLDEIIMAVRGGGAAADTLIARYFARRRYAGSADRRAVREQVYAAIRALGEVPETGRAALLAVTDGRGRDALFDGAAHAPAPYTPGEPVAVAGLAPQWLVAAFARSDIDPTALAAMVARAPLDIRVNRLLADRDAMIAEIPAAQPIAGLPDGLRLPAGHDVAPLGGRAEVQDAGSQIVTMAAAAAPGMAIVDLCAGAGGKALAMAASMAGSGEVLACDIDRDRLSRLAPRAALAGAAIISTRLLDPMRELEALADWHARADCVLIDAPCSGTGTWRRNPEGRWRLTPAMLEKLRAAQARLLEIGAALVRPGGALVYVVCSLLDEEGAAQVARFCLAHPGWQPAPLSLPAGEARGGGVRLSPHRDSTDGFFVARLEAPC